MNKKVIKKVPSYEDARKDCIEDVKKLKEEDKSSILFVGEKPYSAEQLLTELENETDFGKEYVRNYIEGLKLFSDK